MPDNTPSDEIVVRITKLEKRVAKLERATAPASKSPSVGVYYRDGKPCKRKPKKETRRGWQKTGWIGNLHRVITADVGIGLIITRQLTLVTMLITAPSPCTVR